MSVEDIQIGFVGCGEMGRMVLTAALEGGVLQPGTTIVAEQDADRARSLHDLGVEVVPNATQLSACPRLILAVRPQQFAAAAAQLGNHTPDRLAISVMAGIGSEVIKEAMGPSTRVVCVMPNAPVRIRHGMSVVMPAVEATDADTDLAQRIFGTLGGTIRLAESDLWAVTAVSGSGPGYIALVAEAMVAQAVEMGLVERVARQLVAATIAGTGRMLEGTDPASLRAVVATPGGTTEAGVRAMISRGLPEAIQCGIQAARDRGEMLARGGDQ